MIKKIKIIIVATMAIFAILLHMMELENPEFSKTDISLSNLINFATAQACEDPPGQPGWCSGYTQSYTNCYYPARPGQSKVWCCIAMGACTAGGRDSCMPQTNCMPGSS